MYTNKYYNTVPAIELNSVYWSNDIIYDAKYSTAQRRCPLTRRSELACALIVNI